MPANQNRPSKKQRELLSFIDGFIKGYGYGPSYREIMRSLNYKSVSTVAIHVDNLISKGYLAKKDNSARSLEVLSSGVTKEREPKAHVDIDLHKQWLVDRVQMRIDAYHKKPDDNKKKLITSMIESVATLVDEEAADRLRQSLTG